MSLIKGIIKFTIYKLYLLITANLDFTHYRILAWNVPTYWGKKNPGIVGNICYGNNKALKKALGRKYDKHCMIEHGVYFGRVVLENECTIPEISTIYTSSPYRYEVLTKHFGTNFSKRIVTVGPYIEYAKNFTSVNKLKKLKKKLGKVLLVFPSHSSPEHSLEFDFDSWLNEIRKCSTGFDTVIISLFWLDIKNGNYKRYLKEGYLLACNGNRFDPQFLSRQKDLITIADATMSNDVGTHVGYCITLGKPHYIFHQKIILEYYTQFKESEDSDETSKNRMHEYNQLFDAFNEFNIPITENQKLLVEYYWGKKHDF